MQLLVLVINQSVGVWTDSLVPRPRPLSREKGSGDLRPIPRSSLS